MADFQHVRLIEALLFASSEALDERSLSARLPDGTDLAEILGLLSETYAERGAQLVQRDGRWAFRTAPDLAPSLVIEAQVERKLSRAAIETLAIIAYHQPVTRAEIEEVRGVALSKGTLDVLFEAGWIRPRGRRQTPGRPMLWATTPGFLDHFGLVALDDLPGVEELKAAGLLDARPALASYANRAGDQGDPIDIGEDLDEDELERRALELLQPEQYEEEEGGNE
ncbi:SMC-Scp complex subunit ScpB [Telmatospirillum sp.]|uniref:SMC-Scp complex subunit ScpB n=1 Tax=Telmatospirillum sp. TaxID=2079197 RepID=UPI00283E3021|nr:SMC-Scp complex subunit ScpB [Telmatospirillum sp.]MDR3435993.1 SMC-Scp complex subunit ScpB [Telmatospirillum sp.]